ncbi:MAG: glycine zipper domain-containing protein [Gammaproteobacteria bacterium]|jgi:hypothetical protein|nr:glycine zipper domain-containing protein [Gammaproteobacteria bacterium]
MQFAIEDARDIAKLIGAIRVNAPGEFKVDMELVKDTLERLYRFAKERGIRIKLASPSGERLLEFTACGVIIGASVGYYIANVPGALVGAAVGGLAGCLAAHVTIVMDRQDCADAILFKLK